MSAGLQMQRLNHEAILSRVFSQLIQKGRAERPLAVEIASVHTANRGEGLIYHF
jgi:hypothetical protein